MSITRFLAKRVANYGNQQSIGSRLRAKRAAPLKQLIENVSREHGGVEVIDVGGTDRYWSIMPSAFLEEHRVKITIVNLPDAKLPPDHGPFRFVHADGCDLSEFEDKAFHIAHSNSVIEHVGDWSRMVQFSREFRRVAEKYFIQTPNYWFPLEPHCMTPFFHWLPKPARIALVMKFNLGNWEKANSVDQAVRTVESARLLNRKMFRELFYDAHVTTERLALMPKSFIAVRT